MLIYFDESYDSNHQYLILGALFNPHPKFLHREWLEAKRAMNAIDEKGVVEEIKYNNSGTKAKKELCFRAIDIFLKSTSYFRAIVINQAIIDLDRFGNKSEDKKIKTARMYKKFTELLLAHNTEEIYNAVLLTDELTRCNGDQFMEIMKKDFCSVDGAYSSAKNKVTLRDIRDIKSHIVDYHVNQINDILIGCILNNLVPTKNEHKNDIRKYLIRNLSIADLLPGTWGAYSKKIVEEYYPKFNIWYFKPKP